METSVVARILSLLALLLLAASAHAEPRYVGSWLYGTAGDANKALRVAVATEANVCWGAAVATDYQPYLEVRKHNQTALFCTIEGAWEDTTDCAALFMLGQASALVPTSGTQVYDCILVLKTCGGGTQSNIAADGEEQTFTFRIKRWPN